MIVCVKKRRGLGPRRFFNGGIAPDAHEQANGDHEVHKK